MRLKILILSVLTIIGSVAIGQERINTGFVFIDGKYIDAPYTVYVEDLAVYVNGVQITKQIPWVVKDKYAPESDVLVENIPQNLAIEEGYTVKTDDGLNYIDAKLRYLYKNYPYNEAVEKVIEFYSTLPWVQSLTKNSDGDYILENVSGESCHVIICGSIWKRYSNLWGPDGSGPPSKTEVKAKAYKLAERYKSRLKKGDLFLISSENYTEVSYAERKAVNVLLEITRIMDSNISEGQKVIELIDYCILPRQARNVSVKFTDNYRVNKKFKKRLEKLQQKLVNEYGKSSIRKLERNVDLKKIQQKENLHKNNYGGVLKVGATKAYSPDGPLVYAGCSYTFDNAFSSFDVSETNTIIDHVKDQDFNATIIEYKDAVFDTLPGTLTYANLKNMKYADIETKKKHYIFHF